MSKDSYHNQSFTDQTSKELFEIFNKKQEKANWAKEYLAGDSVNNPIDKTQFDEALKAEGYEKFRDNV
ncbi:MAG: hypothetical protein ACKO6C_06980, partial [Alphaproteobacteria bacterium]